MTRWLLTVVVVASAASPLVAADVDYTRDIKPILRERCYACHGALKQKAQLRLDTVALMVAGGKSGSAVKPGDPAGSLLLDRVGDPEESTRMPPEGKPLTADQIATLKAWIEQGAKGPPDEKPEADPKSHWSFQPVRRPPVPKGTANPIDAFLAAEWQKRGLTPAPAADRATLLRRVYIDLIGLPPTRD